MVFINSGLIPARFLTLIAHLTVTLVILSSRDQNVKSCLPFDFTPEEFVWKDFELKVGLSVALGLIAVESIGFLSGLTMFISTTAMISILCHSSACILLSYFLFDDWDCHLYWWIFALCSVVPACIDFMTAASIVIFRKS